MYVDEVVYFFKKIKLTCYICTCLLFILNTMFKCMEFVRKMCVCHVALPLICDAILWHWLCVGLRCNCCAQVDAKTRSTTTSTKTTDSENDNYQHNTTITIDAPHARKCRHRMKNMRETWSMARQQRAIRINAGPQVTGLALKLM